MLSSAVGHGELRGRLSSTGSCEARGAKFHTGDRPRSKGDPITKRFTAKFPCPPAPWSNFQLLECSEASGLKIRENAYRASGSERSQKEKPFKALCQPGASEALLAFWKLSGHTTYQEPKESSQLCWTVHHPHSSRLFQNVH